MKQITIIILALYVTSCTWVSSFVKDIKDNGVSVKSATQVLDAIEQSATTVREYREIADSILNARADYVSLRNDLRPFLPKLDDDDLNALKSLDAHLIEAYRIAELIKEKKQNGELVIAVLDAKKLLIPIRDGVRQAIKIADENKDSLPADVRERLNDIVGGWVVLDAQLIRAEQAIDGNVRASRIKETIGTIVSLLSIIRTVVLEIKA